MGGERFDIGIKRDAGEMLLRERQDGVGGVLPDFVIGTVSGERQRPRGQSFYIFLWLRGITGSGRRVDTKTRTR